MRTSLKQLVWFATVILATTFLPLALRSQEKAPSPLSEDNLTPADFTTKLKEAWTFLKEETDNYNNTVGKKTEFETSAEFEKRTVEARQQYLAKITKYIKDNKLDQRVMGVLLKASLDQYDADNQMYRVACPTVIDAPYNIPTVLTEVPNNAHVALADSIKKGYRTSSVYLKFAPYFRWKVARDIAKAAKDDEESIYFKVRFKVEMGQGEGKKGARFAIVPKQVLLINQKTNATYWEETLK
ncbi:MAG: hypothetical protein AABZ02_00410 [Bacteroidota bacterium]